MNYELNEIINEYIEEIDTTYVKYNSSLNSAVNAFSMQDAKENIAKVTSDEFLQEAYNAATHLRNTLGDADALVSDLSETIRSNIMVTALTYKKYPIEAVLNCVRAMSPEEQIEYIDNIIAGLHEYKRSIEGEDASGH